MSEQEVVANRGGGLSFVREMFQVAPWLLGANRYSLAFGHKQMRSAVQLFRILPALLRCAWALLLIGVFLLAFGYFTHTPWQSYLGLGSLITGYAIAILDMVYRRRRRDRAAGFYVGVTVAPIFSLLILALLGLSGAVILAVGSILHGFSSMQAMHLLHFVGLAFAVSVVIGIPGLALRADQSETCRTRVDDESASGGAS